MVASPITAKNGPNEQATESHHGAQHPMEALPDIDHQIADVGAGQDLPECDAAEELLLCHPGPTRHDLTMNPARQAAPETEKPDLDTDTEQGQQPGRD